MKKCLLIILGLPLLLVGCEDGYNTMNEAKVTKIERSCQGCYYYNVSVTKGDTEMVLQTNSIIANVLKEENSYDIKYSDAYVIKKVILPE